MISIKFQHYLYKGCSDSYVISESTNIEVMYRENVFCIWNIGPYLSEVTLLCY